MRVVADRTDWEKLSHYAATGEMDEYGESLFGWDNAIKTNFSSDGYLYLYVPGEDSFTYLYEASTPSDEYDSVCHWGDIFEYTEYEYNHLVPDIKAARAHDEITLMKTNEYGAGLETWAPVLDNDGKLQAMVEIDYLMPGFQRDLNSFVLQIAALFTLLVVLVLLLMLRYLNRNVTNPIMRLDESVRSYKHGEMKLDLSQYHKDDEIKNLAESFASMTHRIEVYTKEVAAVSAEKERIGAEMNVARQIQLDSVPGEFPAFPEHKEFDIFAAMEPTREIGGDYYDFFLVDDDHLAMVMGDISGDGIPSAHFMVMVKTLIKNRTLQGYTPAEVLQSVSEQLLEGNKAGMYATAWLAVLELSTGKGIAANAGHEHPALAHANGKFELQVYRHSPPIAAMDGVRFRDHGFTLSPGDTVFMYTDGVTNAGNSHGELFGAERIIEALNEEPDASPAMQVQLVKEAVRDFVGAGAQKDDISMLALKYYGPQNAQNE